MVKTCRVHILQSEINSLLDVVDKRAALKKSIWRAVQESVSMCWGSEDMEVCLEDLERRE